MTLFHFADLLLERFDTIVSAQFPVLALAAAAGCIWLLHDGIRNRSRLLLFWGVFYIGLIVALLPVAKSSRYVTVSGIPALLLCVYLLNRIGFRRKLTWVLLAALLLGCGLKLLRGIDPYTDYPLRAAQVIRDDAEKFRNPVIEGPRKERSRLNYYSKLRYSSYEDFSRNLSLQQLRSILYRQAGTSGAIYVLIAQPGDEKPWRAAELGLKEEEWTMLFSSWTDRRRKSNFRVYRFTPLDRGTPTEEPPRPPAI